MLERCRREGAEALDSESVADPEAGDRGEEEKSKV